MLKFYLIGLVSLQTFNGSRALHSKELEVEFFQMDEAYPQLQAILKAHVWGGKCVDKLFIFI